MGTFCVCWDAASSPHLSWCHVPPDPSCSVGSASQTLAISCSRAPWCCWLCTVGTCVSCGLNATCRNRNSSSWWHRARARIQGALKTELNPWAGHWSCHTGGTLRDSAVCGSVLTDTHLRSWASKGSFVKFSGSEWGLYYGNSDLWCNILNVPCKIYYHEFCPINLHDSHTCWQIIGKNDW